MKKLVVERVAEELMRAVCDREKKLGRVINKN